MNTPNINDKAFKDLDFDQLGSTKTEPVKIALLYGSLRARSYSRLLVEAPKSFKDTAQKLASSIPPFPFQMIMPMPPMKRLQNLETL